MTPGRLQWSDEELVEDRRIAVGHFRDARTTEPLDVYLGFFDEASTTFADILDASNDLLDAEEAVEYLLLDTFRQDLCRYIASPPLSADDLKTLADTSLSPGVLRNNPGAMADVMGSILPGLDRQRFPWLVQKRSPTDQERHTAIVATAAMYAMRKTETARRSSGRVLEESIRKYLTSIGFMEVKPASIANSSQGPALGEFCGETSVVGGKADIVIRMSDGRLMPIECKVSNSETNSYKRLIHDCGEKSQTWVKELGPANCVPVAALSGVYSLGNLRKAQTMGLTIIWAHNLDPLQGLLHKGDAL
ncbi:MAG: XamI family restriction endonuclease [Cellulomonadaceae bacterium]|jgi:hypothetical protein|nr:XamI family restriction endonuclease [Cellulomonadaceae bacterium]